MSTPEVNEILWQMLTLLSDVQGSAIVAMQVQLSAESTQRLQQLFLVNGHAPKVTDGQESGVLWLNSCWQQVHATNGTAHLRKLSPLEAAMMKSTTAAAIKICNHQQQQQG